MAEACGNRTHPGRLSKTRNGFEARENHQAPCASARFKSNKRLQAKQAGYDCAFKATRFMKRSNCTGARTCVPSPIFSTLSWASTANVTV